jgi:hypothetical protein
MSAPCWRSACVLTRTELPEGQDHGHPTYCTFRTVQRSPRPAAQVSAGRGGWTRRIFRFALRAGRVGRRCGGGCANRENLFLAGSGPFGWWSRSAMGPLGRQHVVLGAASFRAESGRWRQRRSRPLCFGQSFYSVQPRAAIGRPPVWRPIQREARHPLIPLVSRPSKASAASVASLAGRGASMSAGTTLRGKGSTDSDTSDSAPTKTVGDIAHTRAWRGRQVF